MLDLLRDIWFGLTHPSAALHSLRMERLLSEQDEVWIELTPLGYAETTHKREKSN